MDINEIYKTIVKKLEDFNHFDVVTELNECSSGASTGSEALMAIGSYLIHMKENRPFVYKLIQEYIKDFIDYCRLNGLIIN